MSQTVSLNGKYARPARTRRTRGSKYDAPLARFETFAQGQGIREEFPTEDEATRYLNGLRARLYRLGAENFDGYVLYALPPATEDGAWSVVFGYNGPTESADDVEEANGDVDDDGFEDV